MCAKQHQYHIIGIMSGTSLDGMDVALIQFNWINEQWTFKINKTTTYPYSKEWEGRLREAIKLNSYDFIKLHRAYGQLIGMNVLDFLKETTEPIDYIASHGHTTFHEPHNNISFQIGDGATIAATSGISTISDFRTLDINLGGQGAPLVPIGDQLLFGNYAACINIGGFSNISYQEGDKRLAFDICPTNYILNPIAQKMGLPYDNNGEQGSQGAVNKDLLAELNNLNYYHQTAPKSLGQEWVEKNIDPILIKYNISNIDLLRTLYEHMAFQITQITNSIVGENVLFTGGGAKNGFLMSLISQMSIGKNVIIPDEMTIDFKEALIFAFLGLLRAEKQNNCLASVTGAQRDNCGGVIHIV